VVAESVKQGTAATREEILAAAKMYLEAISGYRDPATLPLAPDVWILEHGRNHGRGADDVLRRIRPRELKPLPTSGEPTFGRDGSMRWFVDVDEGQAIAYYILDLPDRTLLLNQRFHVRDGLIREIEILYHAIDGANQRLWPEDPDAYDP